MSSKRKAKKDGKAELKSISIAEEKQALDKLMEYSSEVLQLEGSGLTLS